MEFKIDHPELEKLMIDDDVDMLSVVTALYLYAGGMNEEQIARPMEDEEKYLFYEILRRSGYKEWRP